MAALDPYRTSLLQGVRNQARGGEPTPVGGTSHSAASSRPTVTGPGVDPGSVRTPTPARGDVGAITVNTPSSAPGGGTAFTDPYGPLFGDPGDGSMDAPPAVSDGTTEESVEDPVETPPESFDNGYGGLFNPNAINAPVTPQLPAISGQDAVRDYFTPNEKQLTVQERLQGLLDSASPLLERARQEGLRTANRRGLANSSIAAEASQNAMIDAMLPIAQQDAQTAADIVGRGQAFDYGFNLEDNKADNSIALARVGADIQRARDEFLRANDVEDRDFVAAQAALKDYTDFVNTTWADLRTTITEIATSPDLNAADKDALISQMISDAEASIADQQALLEAFGLAVPGAA